jgi:hypothetical protein
MFARAHGCFLLSTVLHHRCRERPCLQLSDSYSLARMGVLYRNRFSPAPRERALLTFENLQMEAYM